ncbi:MULTISPECIES: arginine--tRNA ligase [Methanothrix]|uniref:Arginine--tRNA ligase n=1 Tax=Methanothrix thermoacetophila (strain DSM 6194 / JCM 14653 / NBRC 101360 / PT) TaxID=349307 RepID=SYR_METTP|nr:RecName: Full=Arginine--tRNA ligase; AltName: Full=Arginyl-tRNA synthetase; Short=ArgRS [Methanothrix thermoacetophila PT]ABK14014.1 arginyl-tRNA synthetase [Methanothrix thermoacetophila PT]NPU87960.1 arginine--tRNA ligase [Methanothrix sp.]
MFLDFMSEVEGILKEGLDRCGLSVPLENSLDLSPHADLSTTIAFRLSPVLRKDPKDVAAEIYNSMGSPSRWVDRAELVGPYINFYMSRNFLDNVVTKAQGEDAWWGRRSGSVVVEHTSANPDGPLHVGHIRNSVIGDTIVRILRRAGYNVEAQYYVNDMGRQTAMVVWGCDHLDLDDSKPDHAIARVYIAAHKIMNEKPELSAEVDELMRRYESRDPEIVKKFQRAARYAISGIERTLHRMNIHHDSYKWESEFVWDGSVDEILEMLERTGRTVLKDGALQLDLSEEGFEKSLVLRRADGTTLYTTRDLAYHKWKAENYERVVEVLGADHKLISAQLRTALRMLGIGEPEVVIFEFVSLPDGSMSTRRGKFISADELLDEVEKQAYLEVTKRRPEMDEEFRRDVAGKVAVGAVRYDIVRVSADKATTFDWKTALDFEKLSAPFIQYSHARACSIINKAGELDEFDPGLLRDDYEIALIKKIAEFDLVIERAARELKPHQLATYARELAERFNLFYRYDPVLDAKPVELRNARLGLVRASRNALSATLDTLGIDAPESM